MGGEVGKYATVAISIAQTDRIAWSDGRGIGGIENEWSKGGKRCPRGSEGGWDGEGRYGEGGEQDGCGRERRWNGSRDRQRLSVRGASSLGDDGADGQECLRGWGGQAEGIGEDDANATNGNDADQCKTDYTNQTIGCEILIGFGFAARGRGL